MAGGVLVSLSRYINLKGLLVVLKQRVQYSSISESAGIARDTMELPVQSLKGNFGSVQPNDESLL